MKLISFEAGGKASYGMVSGNTVIDFAGRAGAPADLRGALAQGGLRKLQDLATSGGRELPLSSVRFLPVIPNPGKIVCIGLNYRDHQRETGNAETKFPTIFTRYADTQIGHLEPLLRPQACTDFDYEGELAVVLQAGGRFIPEARALDLVAGYSCYNDATARDWQRHTTQFTPGKNFPGTGAFGPWLVTPDEIAKLERVEVKTRVNGAQRQIGRLDQLIFPIPRLISYISQWTPLAAGDVICTGTPGGVGFKMNPPQLLQPGDVVEIEITGIGTLKNTVKWEQRPAGSE